jgi:hypothetical protein
MINKEMGFVVQIEHLWDIITLFKIFNYLFSLMHSSFGFFSPLVMGLLNGASFFFKFFPKHLKKHNSQKKNGIEFVCRQRSSKQKILEGGGAKYIGSG